MIISVSVVNNGVAAHAYFGGPAVGKVCYGDAARHVAVESFNDVVDNEDSIIAARSEIDLRMIGIGGDVVVKRIVYDNGRAVDIGSGTYGSSFVVVEIAILY